MPAKIINPLSLAKPDGYSHGMLAANIQQLLFIAGQVGWNKEQEFESYYLVDQFEQALKNLITVVRAAGGEPTDIVRLVIYVKDKDEYREKTKEIGEVYRKHMDKHFPAMVLVQVASLYEDDAEVEIEGMAVI